ncbi:uncharacterized protein FOMMEDRAFT_155503 [Fomitiporia mediterranea MF3/22]|uniref:uncharacterized protein n=1 Tax=Fomitiporia mediterranea (strain MF3/22) TaxID=694068 RepID=UPI00044077A2|nr:uncharacterized protein FOMMEDRAFT_155503 [Fomitiporia mediterranea MF3/22]EJD04374.1 hypothetical protein FOMMEDRAFT_155503 [Fomitiporia mediterranea MF3/22]
METVFYGINVAVYFLCIYDLLFVRKYASKSTKRLLVGLTTILFAVATAHVSVNCRRLIEGYVNPPDKTSQLKFLIDITQKTNVTKQFLVVLANLFSDVLIIWRIYMVWERNLLICIVPSFLCAGVFICGIAAAVLVSQVTPGQNIFAKQIAAWGKGQFSLSLAMNVSATLLIAARIWWVTRPMRIHDPNRMKPYWRIIVIVIESAAFAVLAQTIELAFYASNFPGVFFVADSVVQIVSMNPLLIIAFVGRTRSQKQSFTSYMPTERMLTEPVYAARTTATDQSEMNFDDNKHFHLSLPEQEKGHNEQLGLVSNQSSGNTNRTMFSSNSEKKPERKSGDVKEVV